MSGSDMLTIDSTSPLPLYYQVFLILKQRIAEGVYSIDSLLPPERTLQLEFELSRSTIRQAIAVLASEGLVSRRRGAGTLVIGGAQPGLGQHFRGSLADLLSETRRANVADVAIDRNAVFPPAIAQRLELQPPQRGTIVRRTRTMDDVPFAFTLNFLSDKYGAELTEVALLEESLLWLLLAKGVELAHASQLIRAQEATLDVARRLGLSDAAPVLFVERLVCDRDRLPIEFVQTWYRGDRYEYHVELDFTADPDALSRLA